MRWLLLPVVFLPHLVLATGIVLLVRNRSRHLFYQAWRGLGLLGLCALPAAIAGNLVPIGWPIYLGGHTVVTIFEENVKDWTGHRRDTLLDNLHVYAALTAVQVLLLMAILVWRWRRGAGWRDPWVWAVAIFMLANSLAAWDWPWYGT